MAEPRKRPRTTRVPSRMDAFLDGTLKVEDLDDEELIRGQLRDKNGEFKGRPPHVIPRSFHTAVVRELIVRGEGKLRGHLDTAMDTLIEIAQNPRANPQARIEAAKYLWERIAGKVPDKSIVEATVRKWETVADDILVDVPEQ